VIGARFADRSTSMMNKDYITQNVIHIDIDPAEIGKNVSTNIPIVGDAKNILTELLKYDYKLDNDEWLKEMQEKRKKYRDRILRKLDNGDINPRRLVKLVSEAMDQTGIMTADVGLNQIWAAHCFNATNDRKYLTSGGLGTMGYSVPASIGAKFASRDSDVVAVVGDGGFQMLLGEMAVIAAHKLGIKIIIFNNSQLGMVKELQDNAYGREFTHGTKIAFNPDFIKLAEAYGIEGMKISKESEMEDAVKRLFANDQPFILECIVDPDFPSTPRLGGKRHA
jgi:acetolactate synthase-1/2/3 large subunit